MRIRSVRIRNFRGFKDETFDFDSHTCLLGPNGAGKSTVLAALNVFFQESGSTTDVASLADEDFHNGNTSEPVRITVTFSELSPKAQQDLSHYVRHNKLTATIEAKFDPQSNRAPVRYFGERLVFRKFAPFFEADKNREKVGKLQEIFREVIDGIEDFPDSGSKLTKQKMIDSLQKYEENNPDKCSLAPSEDSFFGSTKGKHKLTPFIQWVYLPAVKEASEEAEETGSTALGKLLQRTVRRKVNFDEALNELRQTTRTAYDALLEKEQAALENISKRLANRLATYAHSNAGLEVVWHQGSEKSVAINDPKATVKAREGDFTGNLLRFGHGLQRSFLLAILQELAQTETEPDEDREQATLIFACEEPELYQHPPQARHLSNVLRDISQSGQQVLLTTHSPYFVSGKAFEEIRLIRKDAASGSCKVRHTSFERFSERIAEITGEKPDKPAGVRAKLHAALQPEHSEMFFCNKVVLVEGMEDRAYITTALMLDGKWDDVRRAGLHIVPTDRKSGILQMLVIGQELKIPTFVVFDADGNTPKYRTAHGRDNKNLMKALNVASEPFPETVLWGDTYAIWPDQIGNQVKTEITKPIWEELTNSARQSFDPGSGKLSKNPLFIAEMLRLAWKQGHKPESLAKLVERLVDFATA